MRIIAAAGIRADRPFRNRWVSRTSEKTSEQMKRKLAFCIRWVRPTAQTAIR